MRRAPRSSSPNPFSIGWRRGSPAILFCSAFFSALAFSTPAFALISDGLNALDLVGQYDETSFTAPVPVYTKYLPNNAANKFGFNTPSGVTIDSPNNRLFVSDSTNNRILIYDLNADDTLVDRVPDSVLGQPNFYENSSATSQNGLSGPVDLNFDRTNNRLLVSDGTNNRVIFYDIVAITNGENATNVLGQPNFTASAAAATQNGMNGPQGIDFDSANNRLFVGQSTGNRVTVYDIAAITNGENATNVLGQPNFTASASATTQNGMNAPDGVAYDGTNNRLFVADNGNHRVTFYDVAAITNGENATNVLGQPNFTASASATTQNRMNGPYGLFFSSSSIFVADANNNRILQFSVPVIGDGMNAMDGLGQFNESNVSDPVPIFTTARANNAPNKLGLSGPAYLAYDENNRRFFVGDKTNNRVLVYEMNSDGTFVDRIPDNVLGKSDYYTSTAATQQNDMNVPNGIVYDSTNNRLFVAQQTANRVTVYDVTAITNGENATNVLGQPNFTASASVTTQNGMRLAQGLAYDSNRNRLFVAQSGNHRVTVYDVTAITNGENATNVLGQPNFTASAAATTQNGMNAPDGVAYDGTNNRLFVAQNNANRVTVYDIAAITNGENAINVLGQPNFTASTGANQQNAMSGPRGLAYDSANNRLFVSQSTSSRVTVYDLTGIANGENATNVLGQPNYLSSTATTQQNGLYSAWGVAYDSTNNRLFVAQTTGNRVSVYDVSAITNGENAADLIGQYDETSYSSPVPIYTTARANNAPNRVGFSSPNDVTIDTTNHRIFIADETNNRILVYAANSDGSFVDRIPDNILGNPNYYTITAATTQNGISTPRYLAIDSAGNRLFVSDNANNRVLVYDVASIADGENASNVIGQPNFARATAGTTQNGLNDPQGVAYDSANSRLFIAQSTGNRVTVYDVASISDGENATNILGQAGYASSGAANTQGGVNVPAGLAYDSANNRLFLSLNTGNKVLMYDVAAITDGENAMNVLGQPNYASIAAATTQNGMNSPRGLAVDTTNNRLFVADKTNNRLLIYDTTTISDGMNAVNVLGKATFASSTAATQQNDLSGPSGIAYDSSSSRLFVSENANNRVLVYVLGITNGKLADTILGQPNFTAATGAATQNGLNSPRGLAISGSTLFVADSGNHRVLFYDVSAPTNGQNASNLLGQYDETSFTAPVPVYTDKWANNGPNKFGFSGSTMLSIDGTNHRLFFADSSNNRVLVYTLAADNSFSDRVPDNVLGQPNYSTRTAATTQNGMSDPRGMNFDATNNRLFVAQGGNNRVTVYDVTAITDGENATNLLGQPNFTASAAATTQNGMNTPRGLAYDATNTRLFVADNQNNRVLTYDVAAITDGENAVNVLGQAGYGTSTAADTQAGMRGPQGLSYDSGRSKLFVAQNGNHRVTAYDVTSITDGESATNILGQSTYTGTASSNAQNGLNDPRGLAFDSFNNRLFVASYGSHRITVFSTTTMVTGQNADNIIGQPTYAGTTAASTQNGLSGPVGLSFEGTNRRLFVTDSSNNRLTIYDGSGSNITPPGGDGPLPNNNHFFFFGF